MHVDKHQSFLQIDAVDFWWAWLVMCKLPKILSLYFKNRWGINFIFCMKINIKVFYKLTLTFLKAEVRHAPSTSNNKFGVILLYRKEEGKDKVDFLHADKHQTYLQVDTINFGGHVNNLKGIISFICQWKTIMNLETRGLAIMLSCLFIYLFVLLLHSLMMNPLVYLDFFCCVKCAVVWDFTWLLSFLFSW